MCLVVVGYKVHADFLLIVAANRDEFYDRPTAPAHFWKSGGSCSHSQVLAGQDLLAGGTWLGVTQSGRFATITNYREPATQLPEIKIRKSRGQLVAGFLRSNLSTVDYLNQHQQPNDEFYYEGFGLLLKDDLSDTLYYCTNRRRTGKNQDESSWFVKKLEAGQVYVLCNRFLDDPWPKVRLARQLFTDIISEHQDENTINKNSNKSMATSAAAAILRDKILTKLLQNTERPPRNSDQLPMEQTGFDRESEYLLSSIFIDTDLAFGTLSSTIVTMTSSMSTMTPSSSSVQTPISPICCLHEQSYGPKGRIIGSVTESFKIVPPP